MLELRPNCERCDRDLPAEAEDARICSFECTFCSTCAAHFSGVCPNCGGELVRRPVRRFCSRHARAACLVVSLLLLGAAGAADPPSDLDQLMLELLNRARLDPVAEAALHGIDLNDGLEPGTIPPDPVPPLAFDERLISAAIDHTEWMLATNTFSHLGAGGSEFWQRIEAAGYLPWLTVGENLAWRGTSGSLGDATVLAFAHQLHADLFVSPGHRENLLDG